jgi:hypothetical protein
MRHKYLVIYAIPEGMVAVIRHTTNGLLLAELTNRIPVILWQNRFIYHNDNASTNENGFTNYFQKNGLTDLCSLLLNAKTFAPTCWNNSNIAQDNLIDYRTEENRVGIQPLSPTEILSSDADAVIYTHYQHLADIIPLIPKDSEYYGLHNSILARTLYKKYFILADEVSSIVNRNKVVLSGKPHLLGIHIRGSDKIAEYALATPRAYKQTISRLMQDSDVLFVATDSEEAYKQFKKWYGGKMCVIDCERSRDRRGIHFSAADRERAGRDFLVDAYLLSQCDYHLGSHMSHMSFFVQSMVRTRGEPYDNFYDIKVTFGARLSRFITYTVPLFARRTLKKLLFVRSKRRLLRRFSWLKRGGWLSITVHL